MTAKEKDKKMEDSGEINEKVASSAEEKNPEPEKTEEKEPEPAKAEEEPKDLIKPLEELKQKLNEQNDKYLRLYSEFDNFRKRTIKERFELIKSAGEEVISSLLPVLDDFERALKSGEQAEGANSLKDGVKLIHQKMKNILAQQGLKEMEIINGEFNSDLHDAITKVPAPEEGQKGKIIDVVEKGYYLNDKVIRHAKVVVGE